MHYFNYAAALEEEKEMKKLGQKLPTEADFAAALQALPGKYEKEEWYEGGNIFHLLFNGKNKHAGWLSSGGSLYNVMSGSYLWSSSEDSTDNARAFKCVDTEGILVHSNGFTAHPLRALVQ